MPQKKDRKFSMTSVQRVYHTDFFYFLLFVINKEGSVSESNVYSYLLNNREKIRELSSNLLSEKKIFSLYAIRSTLKESIRFKFINLKKGRISLTVKGEHLLQAFSLRDYDQVDRIIAEENEKTYGAFSFLIENLYKVSKVSGLVVFPKPSPKEFDLNFQKLSEKNYLEIYSKKFSEYAKKDIERYTRVNIDSREVEMLLFTNLSNVIIKAKEKNVQKINMPREVKDIMYDYYIKKFFENKLDRVSLNIWIERGKELGIINSSEFYPGTFSKVIYPTAMLSESIPANFLQLTNTMSSSQKIIKFNPAWNIFKEQFVAALWKSYTTLSNSINSFFISVLDLKDVVCFQLQISERLFTGFLSNAYKESINNAIEWDISMEVDRLPEFRTFKSKRYPILINGVPKNIIAIKIKSSR